MVFSELAVCGYPPRDFLEFDHFILKCIDSINEIASQASNAVINIISIATQKDPITKITKNIDQSGTGTIVTSDGVIVTYRSAIIEKNATYKVLLFNGSSFDARLIGVDEFSNLAFLKIEATNLTAISFGDSARAIAGKKLVVIGNSFGEYQNRYATGLLSNINKTFNLAGKTVSSSEKLEGVFEVDFNNQKEYVGGPVIGYSGDLLGVVGMIVVDGEKEYFEIPASFIQKDLALALAGGFEKTPSLGAYYVSITKEYAIAHSLTNDHGALIFSPSGNQGLAIISNSPAEKAGLRINDVVVSVGEKNVDINNPLSNLINEYKKGDSVELGVNRDGQEIKIQVNL